MSTTLQLDVPQSMLEQECQVFQADQLEENYGVNHNDVVKQDTDQCGPLPLRPRLRERKPARPHVLLDNTSHTDSPESKKGRPVIYATKRPAHRAKSKVVQSNDKVEQYTLDDLIGECHMPEMNQTPFVSCPLTMVHVSLERMM
jgi:hypothetical protein